MQTCVNFHSQLSSIMDILAKAAVAEIIKLVDDSCCVLRLEVSHCQNENERLKRKLLMVETELRAARRSGAPGSCSATEHEKLCGTETGPALDSGEVSPTEYLQCDEERDARLRAAEGQEEQRTEAVPVGGVEMLPEQTGPRLSCERLDELHCVVKPECEDTHSAQSPTQLRHAARRVTFPDPEYSEHDRSSQLWASFTLEGGDAARDCPGSPSVTGRYSLIHPFHAEPQPDQSGAELRFEKLHSLGRPWDVISGMVAVKEEADVLSAGSDQDASNVTAAQQHGEGFLRLSQHEDFPVPPKQQGGNHEADQLRADGSPPERGRVSRSGDGPNPVRGARPHKAAAAGKKWFICAHCGKSLAYFSCYKVHLRSHTGEKPYSCLECGKSFTQQSNLTKHESVHSGKKPFGCPQCGKSFRHRYNLTLHQRIHSGEKPFHCTQCGKSFAQSCHFKRHQLCHEGDKPHGYAG